MPTEKTYTIEQMRCLSNLGAVGAGTVDAWQVLDIITTTEMSWVLFENWFHALPDNEKQGGLYRVVEQIKHPYGGGSYYEYIAKPSWTVEPAPIPEKPDDVEEAEPEAVA